jgi:hypothetical protein
MGAKNLKASIYDLDICTEIVKLVNTFYEHTAEPNVRILRAFVELLTS